jgi:hypothetical protein
MEDLMDYLLKNVSKARQALKEYEFAAKLAVRALDELETQIRRLNTAVSIAKDLSNKALQDRIDHLDPVS